MDLHQFAETPKNLLKDLSQPVDSNLPGNISVFTYMKLRFVSVASAPSN